jgi:hypothetical protein
MANLPLANGNKLGNAHEEVAGGNGTRPEDSYNRTSPDLPIANLKPNQKLRLNIVIVTKYAVELVAPHTAFSFFDVLFK